MKLESWLSGRKHLIANEAGGLRLPLRRFESYTLRVMHSRVERIAYAHVGVGAGCEMLIYLQLLCGLIGKMLADIGA